MRRRYRKQKMKFPGLLIFIAFTLFLFITYRITEVRLKPLVAAMAEIKARLIATEAINNAISNKISSKEFDELIKVNFDNEGKVRLLQANTIEMNKMAGEATRAIQQKISDIGTDEIMIPLANVFGSQILANTGPRISISILPAGTVNVDFKPQFETAGINQTRLTIYLEVNTTVQILAPLVSNKVEVCTHIPVSETIIVGDVPDSYINVPSQNNDWMNFVPNKDLD